MNLSILHHKSHLCRGAGGIHRNLDNPIRECTETRIKELRHILGIDANVLLNSHTAIGHSLGRKCHQIRKFNP